MSGIVSFIISAQDKLSAPLANMSKNSVVAKGALGKLAESNKQLRLMVGESGMSINILRDKIARLQQYRDILPPSAEKQIRAFNTEINKLTKQMERLQTINGSAFKKAIKEAWADLPKYLTNPVTMIGAGIVTGINQGMKDARGKLDFGLLVGDKQVGAQIYDKLKGANPLTGGTAIESGKALLNSGFNPEKVTDTVNRLGAVSMGDANKMQSLTAAFAQVNKEGKLTDATLQAMNDAGFKPLTILAEKYNIKLEDMQKRMTDGKIKMQEVNAALTDATNKGGAFGHVLDELNKDPLTMWDRLTDKVFTTAGKLGGVFMPIISGTLEYATIGVDYFGKAIDWVGGVIDKVTGFMHENEDVMWAVGAAVGAGVLAWKAYQGWQVLSYMWTMRNVIGETLMIGVHGALTLATSGLAGATAFLNQTFLKSPIGLIVGGFALIVGGVVLAWNKFEGFRKAVYGIWESVKTIFHNVYKFFMDNSLFGKILKKVFDIDTGKYESVGEAWGKGAAKGAASWEASQKEKEESGAAAATDKQFKNQKAVQTGFKSEVPTKVNEGLNAVSSGGQKVYNITINKMIETLTQYVSGGEAAANSATENLEVQLARLFQSLR